MKILVVDDHWVVREGVRRLLEAELPGAHVVEAGDGAAAIDAVQRGGDWDLVILDISMPGRGGMDALKEIRRLAPRLPVLMLSLHGEDEYAARAFRAGADGYVTKDCPPEELAAAVRKLLAGHKHVSPAFAEKLVAGLAADAPAPHDVLSDREHLVLRKLAQERTVKEIAFELGLSDKTISTYKVRILDKLRLRTTAELVQYAMRFGLLDRDRPL